MQDAGFLSKQRNRDGNNAKNNRDQPDQRIENKVGTQAAAPAIDFHRSRVSGLSGRRQEYRAFLGVALDRCIHFLHKTTKPLLPAPAWLLLQCISSPL